MPFAATSAGGAYLCEWAWLGGERAVPGVLLRIADGRLSEVLPAGSDPAAQRLAGLTLPGFADAHVHAFHRALRGAAGASFWAWRERMYAVAARLDPQLLYELAAAVYAELATAGVTTVGEFHYLHHDPSGARYADPNETGAALLAAAELAGVRLTLIDSCYLSGGVDGRAVQGVQRRFADADAGDWVQRVDRLSPGPGSRLAAAVHSVRAVPIAAMAEVAGYARSRGWPLHLHLSEQAAENDECLAATGRRPAVLAAEAGVLGSATTAVHATHVDAGDIALLAGAATRVCLCPTTEADLADGIGPSGQLAAAGVPLCLGSDSQAACDPLLELRSVELGQRLATGRRGTHRPAELLAAATVGGMRALGWPDAGLAPGAPADLVTLRLDTARTAGFADPLAAAVYAATAADVSQVVCAGRLIAADGRHRKLADLPVRLATTVRRALG